MCLLFYGKVKKSQEYSWHDTKNKHFIYGRKFASEELTIQAWW